MKIRNDLGRNTTLEKKLLQIADKRDIYKYQYTDKAGNSQGVRENIFEEQGNTGILA